MGVLDSWLTIDSHISFILVGVFSSDNQTDEFGIVDQGGDNPL